MRLALVPASFAWTFNKPMRGFSAKIKQAIPVPSIGTKLCFRMPLPASAAPFLPGPPEPQPFLCGHADVVCGTFGVSKFNFAVLSHFSQPL
jgi:hypothetical protein